MSLCLRPTRKGTSCQLPLKGGKCPTHDVNLSARNSAVRAAFAENDPKAFKRHQRRAGKAGFKRTFGNDPDKAAEILATWRRDNPSTPERIVDGWLSELHVEARADVSLFGLYVDRIIEPSLAIEIDGNGLHGPAAPQAKERMARDRRKEALLYALGFKLIRLPECAVKDGSAKSIITENL